MPVVAMKFELDDNPLGTNRITAYSTAGVVVSDTCYSNALIVTPDTVIPDWPPRVLADIALQHMQQLLHRSWIPGPPVARTTFSPPKAGVLSPPCCP